MKTPRVVPSHNRQYAGLKMNAIRPNSMDIFKLPSRFENTLRYPDGRVEHSPKQK